MLFRRKMFKKQNKTIKRVFRTLLIIFLSLVVFVHYDNSITDIIVGIAIRNAEETISKCTSRSVSKVLDKLSLEYDDIIFTERTNGNISSVTANSPNINLLKSEIVITTSRQLEKYNCLETVVQLGSLSGMNILSNRGPDIHILYDLYCSTSADIDSVFKSAGLNQTCHKIVVNIVVKYCLVLNDGDHISSVNNDFIIAENVIVGEVPNAYGSIYGLTAKEG